jgi:hypothetical protein
VWARCFHYPGIVILSGLLIVNIYRAWSQSICHDEAFTYDAYLSGTFASLFDHYDANHHFLFTLLAKLSVSLFGVSEFAMRLPTVLAGALYFWSVYRLSIFLFSGSAYCLLSVLLLSLNPLLLDFLVAARGYGLALALFFYAFAECLAYMDAAIQTPERTPGNATLYRAGTAIALSVAANLVFLLPVVVFGFLFLAALVLIDKRVDTAMAPTDKELPPHRNLLLTSLLSFAAPAGALLLLLSITAPFAKAEKDIFYVGVGNLIESLRSLAEYSFSHNPGLWGLNYRYALFQFWRSATLFLVVPVTLLVAGWLWLRVCRNEWRNPARYLPSRAELVLYLSLGTAAGAALLLVVGHYSMGLPYPEGRTGIYFLPLFALASLGWLQMFRVRAGLQKGLAWGLTAVLAISIGVFGIQFNARHFAVWQYDADTKAIVQAIAFREANGTGPLRVGTSWPLAPSINFYRVTRKLHRIQPVDRLGPRGDFDYYVLWGSDTSLAETQHLKTLMKYPVSGTVLAVR